MRNYIIGLLTIALLVSISVIYKKSKNPVLEKFPVTNPLKTPDSGMPPMYLYLFFSSNNCHSCLESIEVLNKLPPPFVVTGIVPGHELENEASLRAVSRADFSLIPMENRFRKYMPNYAPTIYGVASDGKIIFVLPSVPDQKDYLYNFLVNLHSKSFTLLIPQTGDS